MLRAHDVHSALALLERQLQEHPEWERNASLRQLRGDALLGLAKLCRVTGKNFDLPSETRQRAWREFHAYLMQAERELREALAMSIEPSLTELIQRNLAYLDRLRRENPPLPHPGRRGGQGTGRTSRGKR
jgi:hypothetical protein